MKVDVKHRDSKSTYSAELVSMTGMFITLYYLRGLRIHRRSTGLSVSPDRDEYTISQKDLDTLDAISIETSQVSRCCA